MEEKVKAARLSIFSNTSLIIIKLIVGLITGSVSIISEAIHSTMDLAASIIAFFSVKISSKPADREHPYGHGKFENVSGVIEAMLILVASLWIIIESVGKILNKQEMFSSNVGFLIMFLSAGINYLVSRKLYETSKKVDSIALEADALHLKTDVYTSLGVGLGLFFIWLTNFYFLDPLIAILVAVFILKEAFVLLKTAFNPLLDVKLCDTEIDTITKTLSKYNLGYCNFHKLRTRKSGNKRYIDLHLVFPQDMSVKDAHDICDKIETEIEHSLKNTESMIHLESCNNNCENCQFCKRAECKTDRN
ncbi:cation diffusion facilitator family transporter [Clostridium sp. WILCCON 0269]|uniref:Cation diffusion facilitator family transporter n=1 Tax=Candidatus Clostridium eludens TaxID=3381663 RepID=A0ABW8SF81_9CLOT